MSDSDWLEAYYEGSRAADSNDFISLDSIESEVENPYEVKSDGFDAGTRRD